MDTIFHIATEADWSLAKARERYTVASLETEGFIHASTRAQVVVVANALFRGRTDLVLLKIDATRVSVEIRYENCEGGEALFPHLYGPLEVEAVAAVLPFAPDESGRFALPHGA